MSRRTEVQDSEAGAAAAAALAELDTMVRELRGHLDALLGADPRLLELARREIEAELKSHETRAARVKLLWELIRSEPDPLPGDASGAYTGAHGTSDAYRATADPLAASSTVRAAVSPAHGDHEHAARSTSAARHAP